MSHQLRPVETRLLICDLCNEPIPDHEPGERGSLTHGYIAHKAEASRMTWIYLLWPPAGRDRTKSYEWRQQPENRKREYDFHADCILRLVEANLYDPSKTENKES